MASALSGIDSTLPWGQSKKTEGTGGTPPPTEPTPTEPTTSEPMPTTGTSEPVYGGTSTGNGVTPMPDRLRDLIIEYSSQDAPTATALHELVLRMAASATAPETPLAPEQLQRTRAEIIAAASVSIVAQANHTRDSVSALLGTRAAA